MITIIIYVPMAQKQTNKQKTPKGITNKTNKQC